MTENKAERPEMFEIKKIVPEAKDINTLWFRGNINADPGQFVMLWVPGTGQKPFGVSYQEKGRFALTIKKVGKLTEKVSGLKAGDRIGIQGPYGRGFSCRGKKVAIVGGGYGTAPLALLADKMSGNAKDVFFITGAVSEEYVLYRKRFKKSNIKTVYSTDDGSFGHKGLCTECLEDLISKEKIDYVYCCGPEMMMLRVFEICAEKKIPAEFSLERYMKCGFGVCGSCSLDGTGWRVCKDGPVFTSDEMKKVTEFGRYKRDGSGRRVKL
jgi:dihydroorotate dehydrogenase electron transfer subunit